MVVHASMRVNRDGKGGGCVAVWPICVSVCFVSHTFIIVIMQRQLFFLSRFQQGQEVHHRPMLTVYEVLVYCRKDRPRPEEGRLSGQENLLCIWPDLCALKIITTLTPCTLCITQNSMGSLHDLAVLRMCHRNRYVQACARELCIEWKCLWQSHNIQEKPQVKVDLCLLQRSTKPSTIGCGNYIHCLNTFNA